MKEDVTIWHNGHLLKIGEIIDKILFVKRDSSTYFRIFSGFALSEQVIDRLLDEGVRDIYIEYTGERGKLTYRCRTMDFVKFGEPYFYDQRSHIDKQYVLADKHMEVFKKEVSNVA